MFRKYQIVLSVASNFVEKLSMVTGLSFIDQSSEGRYGGLSPGEMKYGGGLDGFGLQLLYARRPGLVPTTFQFGIIFIKHNFRLVCAYVYACF